MIARLTNIRTIIQIRTADIMYRLALDTRWMLMQQCLAQGTPERSHRTAPIRIPAKVLA